MKTRHSNLIYTIIITASLVGCSSVQGTLKGYGRAGGFIIGLAGTMKATEDRDPGDDTQEEFDQKRSLAGIAVGLGLSYAFGAIGDMIDKSNRKKHAKEAQESMDNNRPVDLSE